MIMLSSMVLSRFSSIQDGFGLNFVMRWMSEFILLSFCLQLSCLAFGLCIKCLFSFVLILFYVISNALVGEQMVLLCLICCAYPFITPLGLTIGWNKCIPLLNVDKPIRLFNVISAFQVFVGNIKALYPKAIQF